MDHQGTMKTKQSGKTRRNKNRTNTDKKMKKEETKKTDYIRPRLVFPVQKVTSVISGIFSRKKPLDGENREQRDGSAEVTESDETFSIKNKQNPIQNKESFWEMARIRLEILILGQRLMKTRRQRSLSESKGEEELCKKRILMGERCKPINKSGVLQYGGDGILLPDP
ncbi:hypothetical protein CARUB_v10003806mg [Capsella rubella]|uniref:Uncharacterized protein n=1 Tax=Capsella rubella TaxID=81985 RepID=R0HGY6_9BRAS|nr:hypothetical protein CARUB_v10003806mg [Capsella rubella]